MHTLKVQAPGSSKLISKLNSVSHKLKAGTKKHSCVSWSRLWCDYMDIWAAIRRQGLSHSFSFSFLLSVLSTSLLLLCLCSFVSVLLLIGLFYPVHLPEPLENKPFPLFWEKERWREMSIFCQVKNLHWHSASSDKLAKYTQHQILTRDGKTEESGCVKSELSSLAEVIHETALLFLMELYLLTWIYPLESVVLVVGLLLMPHTWALNEGWHLPLSSTGSIKTKQLPWELHLENVSIEEIAEHLAKGQ